METAAYDAAQQALAVAFLRRVAEAGTHPTAAQHQLAPTNEGQSGGESRPPRARGYRTSSHKKIKGLPSEGELIPLNNQGDGNG